MLRIHFPGAEVRMINRQTICCAAAVGPLCAAALPDMGKEEVAPSNGQAREESSIRWRPGASSDNEKPDLLVIYYDHPFNEEG